MNFLLIHAIIPSKTASIFQNIILTMIKKNISLLENMSDEVIKQLTHYSSIM